MKGKRKPKEKPDQPIPHVTFAGGHPSPVLNKLMGTKNPDYVIEKIEQAFPFELDVEFVGEGAGRLFLREQNRVVSVVMSDYMFEQIARKAREFWPNRKHYKYPVK